MGVHRSSIILFNKFLESVPKRTDHPPPPRPQTPQTHAHTYLSGLSTVDFNRREFSISGILHATVDIHFRVFTDEHGLFVYMCVNFNYLTMDYPLPLPIYKAIIGHFFLSFLFICIPMRFATEWRVSYNHGRPRLVCVHGYTGIFTKIVHG